MGILIVDEEVLSMSEELQKLLEKARRVQMTPEQAEEQRRSFAYGNTKIENDSITRETVDRAAEMLRKK
jgi:hypothetical protein